MTHREKLIFLNGLHMGLTRKEDAPSLTDALEALAVQRAIGFDSLLPDADYKATHE